MSGGPTKEDFPFLDDDELDCINSSESLVLGEYLDKERRIFARLREDLVEALEMPKTERHSDVDIVYWARKTRAALHLANANAERNK